MKGVRGANFLLRNCLMHLNCDIASEAGETKRTSLVSFYLQRQQQQSDRFYSMFVGTPNHASKEGHQ